MLHVTNGDSVVESWRSVGFPGEYLPWRDVLHDGAVPRRDTLEQMSDVRAKEIHQLGGYGDYKTADVEGMYNQPIGDLFGLRVAGKYTNQGEGFWQSRVGRDDAYSGSGANYSSSAPIVRNIGKREVAQGRVRGGWDITNQLRLDLKVEGVKQHSEMGQPEAWGALCSSGHQPIDPQNCTDATMYHDTDGNPYQGDWRGKFPYIIHELNETMLVVMNDPAIAKQFSDQQLTVMALPKEKFGELIKADTEKWRKVVAEANIKLE